MEELTNLKKLIIWLELENINLNKLIWLLEYQSILKEKGIII